MFIFLKTGLMKVTWQQSETHQFFATIQRHLIGSEEGKLQFLPTPDQNRLQET